MSADPNNPEDLFAAAQDFARSRGLLHERRASPEQSRFSRVSYVLNDSNGAVIARIPIAEVRALARARHALLMRLPGIKDVAEISRKRHTDRLRSFRQQPDHVRALAWALSEGRRVPTGAFSRRDLLLGLLLLLLGVIPGVIYLFWAWARHRQYLRDLESLMVRWRGQKRPDPSEEWFESLGG